MIRVHDEKPDPLAPQAEFMIIYHAVSLFSTIYVFENSQLRSKLESPILRLSQTFLLWVPTFFQMNEDNILELRREDESVGQSHRSK